MDSLGDSLTWYSIIKLGVATALINQCFGWLREYRKESKETERSAQYGGLRVAVTLEEFVTTCVEEVGLYDVYKSSKGGAGSSLSKMAKLNGFPTDIEWKLLEPSLASRALTLPMQIVAADRSVRFSWEVHDEDGAADTCAEGMVDCALSAWRIAKDIRARYNLPLLDLKRNGFDPIEFLEKEEQKYRERRERPNAIPA